MLSNKNSNRNIINSDLGSLLDENSSTNTINVEATLSKSKTTKNSRMKSVDVFRGLCLSIMIFANYGAGGYSFLVNLNFYLFKNIQDQNLTLISLRIMRFGMVFI